MGVISFPVNGAKKDKEETQAWVIGFPVGNGIAYVLDDHDRPSQFATEREALLEIADNMEATIAAFRAGERDDLGCEDFTLEVCVDPDGSMYDEQGKIWPQD